MQIKRCIAILLLSATALITAVPAKSMDHITFQDAAAEVMMNTLSAQPKNNFLRQLYTRLLFVPVWVDEKGTTRHTEEFFNQILHDATLDKEGKLYQDAQHLAQLNRNLADASLAEKLSMEFKISQLYKGYADYSIYGSINWGAFLARLWNRKTEDVHADWVLHRPKIDPVMVLEDTLLHGSFSKAFDKAVPKRYNYRQLQKALAKYMHIKEQGGWQPVFFKGVLVPGKSYAVIPQIRRRLKMTDDYRPCGKKDEMTSTIYDNCLKKAVIRFQSRNGLSPTGKIGKSTRAALNKMVERRILTLRLNLDRIKWLKDPPEDKHIVINIPDFMLYFIDNDKVIKKIRVIVGKPDHPTPIFSDVVETIVLNPYWNIPQSIIQKEMIPKLIKNSKALKRKGIQIYNGWGKNAKIIDPATVDWRAYLYSKTVPYRFAQLPGKRNALGKIKFLFPNQFSVYMHDTPTKSLFNRHARAFSHGCVRLAQPKKLLETFASFEPNIDYSSAQKKLKTKNKEYISLSQKIPVDIIYLTAWIDDKGQLQFRNDIYGYDKMQLKAYRKW